MEVQPISSASPWEKWPSLAFHHVFNIQKKIVTVGQIHDEWMQYVVIQDGRTVLELFSGGRQYFHPIFTREWHNKVLTSHFYMKKFWYKGYRGGLDQMTSSGAFQPQTFCDFLLWFLWFSSVTAKLNWKVCGKHRVWGSHHHTGYPCVRHLV